MRSILYFLRRFNFEGRKPVRILQAKARGDFLQKLKSHLKIAMEECFCLKASSRCLFVARYSVEPIAPAVVSALDAAVQTELDLVIYDIGPESSVTVVTAGYPSPHTLDKHRRGVWRLLARPPSPLQSIELDFDQPRVHTYPAMEAAQIVEDLIKQYTPLQRLIFMNRTRT
jgi:hypothetical protein